MEILRRKTHCYYSHIHLSHTSTHTFSYLNAHTNTQTYLPSTTKKHMETWTVKYSQRAHTHTVQFVFLMVELFWTWSLKGCICVHARTMCFVCVSPYSCLCVLCVCYSTSVVKKKQQKKKQVNLFRCNCPENLLIFYSETTTIRCTILSLQVQQHKLLIHFT